MNFNVTVIASSMPGVCTTASRRNRFAYSIHGGNADDACFCSVYCSKRDVILRDNGGECDDYNSTHDLTQSQQDWINGTYDFKLVDGNTIELNIIGQFMSLTVKS